MRTPSRHRYAGTLDYFATGSFAPNVGHSIVLSLFRKRTVRSIAYNAIFAATRPAVMMLKLC